jgi:hypothetical protein
VEAVKENTSAVVTFDPDAERYTVTVGGRTVRGGQLPGGIDLIDVYRSDLTILNPREVRFDSRGLLVWPQNTSVEVHLENAKNTKRTIRLSLSGSSRVEKG